MAERRMGSGFLTRPAAAGFWQCRHETTKRELTAVREGAINKKML